MHGIYLGVAETLLNRWFCKTNRDMNFYIGDKVLSVTQSLCNQYFLID